MQQKFSINNLFIINIIYLFIINKLPTCTQINKAIINNVVIKAKERWTWDTHSATTHKAA